MIKDTARLLISWKCNLNCEYCCNKLPDVRWGIHPARLDEISWRRYKTFCISGGEPLLFPGRIADVCARIPEGAFVVLYTNGTPLTRRMAQMLRRLKIDAINVGLHHPASFGALIHSITNATADLGMSVRFHLQDIYNSVPAQYPGVEFRLWKMNECDRANEDRFLLEDWDG